jgi:NADPH:quinone reductase
MTVRAYVLTEFDATPAVADVDVPEPAEGEVRVRVHAAAVNGFDISVASGYLKDMMEHRFPVVLGKDFAGTVDAVGPGVSGYEVGDRVFGVVTKPHLGDGSFAEYVTVSTAVGLATLPEEIDFVTGAALGLAGVAAISAVDAAVLQHGQTVLVVGATGGVGNQAVQLAAKAGGRVVATAATEEEQTLLRDLGAAELVDYTGDVVAACCTSPVTRRTTCLCCDVAAAWSPPASCPPTRSRPRTSPSSPSTPIPSRPSWTSRRVTTSQV